MRFILITLLSVFSSLSFSEASSNFICIAEHAAGVKDNGNGVLTSDSGIYQEKYMLSKRNGLREFGNNNNWLSKCNYNDEGDPIWCESPNNNWSGVFMLKDKNVFVLSFIRGSEDGIKMTYTWVAGHCSRL